MAVALLPAVTRRVSAVGAVVLAADRVHVVARVDPAAVAAGPAVDPAVLVVRMRLQNEIQALHSKSDETILCSFRLCTIYIQLTID